MKLLNKLLGRREAERPICCAIVPAAGNASRMGGENKMLMLLDGIPVLARTLLALDSATLIDEIVVATREQDIVAVAELCKIYGVRKNVKIVRGGENRLESVLLASLECRADAAFLAVHDGARPIADGGFIDNVIRCAYRNNAAAPAVPVKDTVKVVVGGVVKNTPDRSTLQAVQTPQVFDRDFLRGALKKVRMDGTPITDDCSAVELMGMSVKIVEGDERNIKVTTPTDLAIVRLLAEVKA